MSTNDRLVLIYLVAALGLAQLGLSGGLIYVRFLILLPLILFLPGFLLTGISLKREQSLGTVFISSFLLSLLLLYPAVVLTVIFEGQSARAVFSSHLGHSITSLVVITLALWSYLKLQLKKQLTLPAFNLSRKSLLILSVCCLLFSSLVFRNLGRADVAGDEYDLSYQAYNLIDGIADGRKSYLLSFNTHPPLALDVEHFLLQSLHPQGLDTLSDWQYRLPEAIIGLFNLILVYFLARDFFSEETALAAVLLLSVNNYHIWMSRFVNREIFLTAFMVGFVYFFKKLLVDKENQFLPLVGLTLGAAMLVKESGLILFGIMAVVALFSLSDRNKMKKLVKIGAWGLMVFSPVIIYNLVMYFLTGYADSLFVRLLPGARNPFATTAVFNPLIINSPTAFFLLGNVLSWPVFGLSVFGLAVILVDFVRHKKTPLGLVLLWFTVSALFYLPFMIRAYYLHFLVVPLSIFTAVLLSKISSRASVALIAAVLISYSYFYSFQTNIAVNYQVSRVYADSGRSGGPLLFPGWQRNFSLAARSWSEDYGWKDLLVYFARQKNFCLKFSSHLDEIALRRYFWYHDQVKLAYLHRDKPRFPNCSPEVNRFPNEYLVSQEQVQGYQLARVIKNQAGIVSFYVYDYRSHVQSR